VIFIFGVCVPFRERGVLTQTLSEVAVPAPSHPGSSQAVTGARPGQPLGSARVVRRVSDPLARQSPTGLGTSAQLHHNSWGGRREGEKTLPV